MERYKVAFQGAEARYSTKACNFMMVKIGENELYAEVIWDNDMDETEFDNYSYPILKDEIIRQAKEIGVEENQLEFWWD